MNKGFTLIELLVVVLIIGILSAVALPQYTTAVEKARSAEALTLMGSVAGSAERFLLQKDRWPDNSEFSKLDIEVPLAPNYSSSARGGKDFTITMIPSGDILYISARRRLNQGSYTLQTKLVQNSNGTISSTRYCCTSDGTPCSPVSSSASSTDKSTKYCLAVSNGSPESF